MTARKQGINALDLLISDHKEVRKLIHQYEKMHETASTEEKQALAEQICAAFVLHADIEEQYFYPAARDLLEETELIEEAEVEHASVRDLASQIRAMQPDDPMYDATVKVLGEYIEHHAEEEEKEMFPKLKKTKADFDALGQEMMEAKETAQAGFLASDSKATRKGHGRSPRA